MNANRGQSKPFGILRDFPGHVPVVAKGRVEDAVVNAGPFFLRWAFRMDDVLYLGSAISFASNSVSVWRFMVSMP